MYPDLIRMKWLPLLLLFGLVCCTAEKNTYRLTKNYVPDNRPLFDTIVRLDSIFFGYYNTCETNLDKYAALVSDSLEFYHDQGGLLTSKPAFIEATRKNICGKVTREVVKGSLEVYPINDYGAVEMGLHKFHNNTQPPGTPSHASRFVIIWKREADGWKIRRVVSLH